MTILEVYFLLGIVGYDKFCMSIAGNDCMGTFNGDGFMTMSPQFIFW